MVDAALSTTNAIPVGNTPPTAIPIGNAPPTAAFPEGDKDNSPGSPGTPGYPGETTPEEPCPEGATQPPTNDTPPSTLLKTATTITTAILLAFTLCWTMFVLTVGVHNLRTASVQRAGGVSPLSQVLFDHFTMNDEEDASNDPSPTTTDDNALTSEDAETNGPDACSLHDAASVRGTPAHAQTQGAHAPRSQVSPPLFFVFSSLFNNSG